MLSKTSVNPYPLQTYKPFYMSAKDKHYFELYSRRLSRYCFLCQVCGPEHLIFKIEIKLLKMAESLLREHLFSRYSLIEIELQKLNLEQYIKQLSKEIIESDIDDDINLEKSIEMLDSIDLSPIFKLVN